MGHPEALLLVDDQKPQIFVLHICGQHPVRTDDDIHHALLQIRDRLLLLRRRAEPGEQIDPHRKIFHPLHKRIIMLLRQNGRGHQIDYLLVLLHRLEGRPDGDLRLAVPHIAADQTIHDPAALHILLGGHDRADLVLRLLEGEHLFKFPLPDRIFAVLEALALLPCRIQLHQILCDLVHRAAHLRLGLVPFLGAQLI